MDFEVGVGRSNRGVFSGALLKFLSLDTGMRISSFDE